MLELPKIMNDPKVNLNPAIFLSNAAAAFGEHLMKERASVTSSSTAEKSGWQLLARCCCVCWSSPWVTSLLMAGRQASAAHHMSRGVLTASAPLPTASLPRSFAIQGSPCSTGQ